MKNIFLSWCVLSFIFVSISLAQITTSGLSKAEDLSKPVYGVGLSAGWASGVGLSFRSHFPSKSSLQIVFGIIKTSDKLAMNVGGEYQYDLVRSNAMRFFIAGTLAYFYHGIKTNELEGPFRMGGGIGGEFHAQGALHVTIEGIFVYFSDGRVIPLPQIAAHYYFF
jgi:hypothetical protein